MYKSYNLDPNLARQADEKSGRIEETGAYTGRIKYAIAIKWDSGAEGIELYFEGKDRREARSTICTYKRDGSVNDSGMRTLNAIMTCCMVKSITPTESMAELWDSTTRSVVSRRVVMYTELQKPIGILFQRAPEEYQKDAASDVKVMNRMEVYAPYHAQSGMTASEILTKATAAEKLQQMLAAVKDKPLKKLKPKAAGSHAGNASHADDFEDDIPF